MQIIMQGLANSVGEDSQSISSRSSRTESTLRIAQEIVLCQMTKDPAVYNRLKKLADDTEKAYWPILGGYRT